MLKKKKDICTPMFIAALFTIAKTWKQSRCPHLDKWNKWIKEVVVYIYKRILFSHNKQGHPAICKNMVET